MPSPPGSTAFTPAPPPDGAAIGASRTQFLGDFADGTVGRHHNTFQHRSRVLRQLTDANSLAEAERLQSVGKDAA